MRIAIVHSSREGHTARLAHRIANTLSEHHTCRVEAVAQWSDACWNEVDAIVIGGSVHYGRFAVPLQQFIAHHAARLNALPSAFFSVSLVARKAGKDTVEGNVYTRKFLERSPWQPQQCGVFAGAVEYDRYRLWDRVMVRLIMAMGRGETGRHAHIDYTDWRAVTRFAEQLNSAWRPSSGH